MTLLEVYYESCDSSEKNCTTGDSNGLLCLEIEKGHDDRYGSTTAADSCNIAHSLHHSEHNETSVLERLDREHAFMVALALPLYAANIPGVLRAILIHNTSFLSNSIHSSDQGSSKMIK